MSHDVFICHSSVDRVIANAVCATLEQHRIRCWIAPRDVTPGREFAESIIEAIHSSKLTILVFSAHSNSSSHVHKEIERSVNAGIPILPFRVEDVTPSPALEYFISDAHWLDALTPPLEQHLDYLVGTVTFLLHRPDGLKDGHAASPGTPSGSARGTPPGTPPGTPAPAGQAHPARARRLGMWIGIAAVVALAVVAGLLLTRGSGTPAAGPPVSSSSTSTSTSTSTVGRFSDEFTTRVGPGWSWLNEKAGAWRVTPAGRLEIVGQQPPPYRNVLLRAAPTGSYSVRLDLTFPAAGKGFAGLVLTGADPGTRLQFGWTETALVAMTYQDGNAGDDSEMMTADLPVKPGGDAQLLLQVKDGRYTTKIYDPKYDTYYDMGTGRLDPTFTKLGLLVYSRSGATLTAAFDRIDIF